MNGEVSSEKGRAGGQQEQHAQLAAAAVAVTHILAFLRAGALLPRPRHVPVGLQLGRRQHVQAGVHRQPAAGGLGNGQAAREVGCGAKRNFMSLVVRFVCGALGWQSTLPKEACGGLLMCLGLTVPTCVLHMQQGPACLRMKSVGPTPVDHTHRPKGMMRPSCRQAGRQAGQAGGQSQATPQHI